MFEIGAVLIVLTLGWLSLIIYRIINKSHMEKSKLQLKLALFTLILAIFFLYHGSGPKIESDALSLSIPAKNIVLL